MVGLLLHPNAAKITPIYRINICKPRPETGPKLYTVPTTKSLHSESLRFAIFWEIFKNCQLKSSDQTLKLFQSVF